MSDGGIQYWQTVGQFLQEIEMGRYASDAGGGYEEAPAGNHVAICVRLIDLGTQHGTYEGKPTVRNQVMITWELPNELMSDGRPYTVGRFYTNSLSEKANLRPDLEAWRGRPFSPEELARFDLQNILGKPCMAQIVHNEKGKAKVASVAQLPKGMTAPSPQNKPFAFWLPEKPEDEFDEETFDRLPDGLKNIIKQSDEFKALNGSRNKGMGAILGMDSDVPF